jgi:hypothetical protein
LGHRRQAGRPSAPRALGRRRTRDGSLLLLPANPRSRARTGCRPGARSGRAGVPDHIREDWLRPTARPRDREGGSRGGRRLDRAAG